MKENYVVYLSEPSLAFSHLPGHMFPTDTPDSSSSIITPPSDVEAPYTKPNPELTPLSFLVSHNPLLYSLASKRAVARIRELEMIIGEDPGKHVNWFHLRSVNVKIQLVHNYTTELNLIGYYCYWNFVCLVILQSLVTHFSVCNYRENFKISSGRAYHCQELNFCPFAINN